MTGQRAAQRKNSPRQWERPFGRAPREICPAILTHPQWGGDCTPTMKWQDAGAGLLHSLIRPNYVLNANMYMNLSSSGATREAKPPS